MVAQARPLRQPPSLAFTRVALRVGDPGRTRGVGPRGRDGLTRARQDGWTRSHANVGYSAER
jgi:hypothetical protein